MKTFFSSTFVKEETLEEAKIYHPIKLAYYKITNEEDCTQEEKAKFGIKVIKTEYTKEGIQKDNKKVRYLSNNEKKKKKILRILERNEVTPIGLEDVLKELII